MRMCTDDVAASTSAKMRGKKLSPSGQGSIVAAVERAKDSAASCGRTRERAANASVAALAPAAVTAAAALTRSGGEREAGGDQACEPLLGRLDRGPGLVRHGHHE